MHSSSPRHARTVVVGGGTMGADVAVVLARGGALVTVVDPGAARRELLLQHIAIELAKAGFARCASQVSVCAALEDAVATWTLTSRRLPIMPSGSWIPSCSSST